MWEHSHYVVKNKMFSLLSRQFYICGPAPEEKPLLLATLKAFRLKEDIPINTVESPPREVLRLKARQILDFGVTYDVFDSATGHRLGALRRKGLKSMLRDLWEVWNADDQVVARIEEDSWLLALVRRFVFGLIPQKYQVHVGEQPVAQIKRNTYLLRNKVHLLLDPAQRSRLDPKILIAAALLLFAIEGKQD